MSFFPQDYTPAQGGGGDYTKLQQGENRLRVVYEDLLIGWSYWDADKTCHRFPYDQKPTSTPGIKPGEKLKEFIALGVYNYDTKKLECWEITQVTIKDPVVAYTRHEDYGDLRGYGLTVKMKGSGKETEYSVIAGTPKPLPDEIQKLVAAKAFKPRALLTNGAVFEDAKAGAPAAPVNQRAQPAAPAEPADNDLPF